MTKTGRQSTRYHEMHTVEHALKEKTPIYDFSPVGESRLYWYCEKVKAKLFKAMFLYIFYYEY